MNARTWLDALPEPAVVPPLRDRLARIIEEAGSPLGWAMRGISSWEQEYLAIWCERSSDPAYQLSPAEEQLLANIERLVFGVVR